MSTIIHSTDRLTAVPQVPTTRVMREPTGWRSWVTTTDHKRIGIMYMVLAFCFMVLGGTEALLVRTQLAVPSNDLLTPQTFNELFTMHGMTMVFLFVMPVMAGFGNYFLPLMIGARDMAYPKLNALSFWMLVAGGLVFYGSVFWNPPECGWTCYPPLADKQYLSNSGVDAWIYLVHLTGIASLVGSINFIVTVKNMRAPGMGWGRLPLFVIATLTTSVLLWLTLPVVAAAATMLLTDRHFGSHFFKPEDSGSPLLWQHLFWFFGHPEVYVMVLPGFGIISEVLPVFSRKPIFGYRAVYASTAVIAFLGSLVWAHHMFTTPTATALLVVFMLGSFLIAVPTGIKIFNWIFTLWNGTIEFTVALLFAVGFVGTFLMGGITGIFVATFPVDWQLHDTYYVVAHFHYTLMGGAVFGVFSGLYYWFPKITGRMLSEKIGRWAFWLMLIGFHVTFLTQHSAGLEGMPRRIYEYADFRDWALLNLLSTIGAFTLGTGMLLSMFNVLRSLKRGAVAGPDPWRANTLEWFTTSPPPVNNFDALPRIRSVEPMKDIRRQVAVQSGVPLAELEPAGGAGTH